MLITLWYNFSHIIYGIIYILFIQFNGNIDKEILKFDITLM